VSTNLQKKKLRHLTSTNLVSKDDAGVSHQRHGEGQPAFHSAGQVPSVAVGEPSQAHSLHGVGDMCLFVCKHVSIKPSL
jgi:hypothetical protein